MGTGDQYTHFLKSNDAQKERPKSADGSHNKQWKTRTCDKLQQPKWEWNMLDGDK